jgi:penicillin-binding protein 1C
VAIRPPSGPAKGPAARPRPALDPRAAFIVGDILSDPNARAAHLWHRQRAGHPLLDGGENRHQQGHARQLGVGWSQRYTVGVWVGNASGAPMHDVSGTSGAAPVWAAVMQYLHARTPSRAPAPRPASRPSACSFGAQLEAAAQRVVPAGHGTGKIRYQSIADNDHFDAGKEAKKA